MNFAVAYNRVALLYDLWRNDGALSVPYQVVMIETTATCNLDCPICPVRRSDNIMQRSARQIPVALFKEIVDKTRDLTETYCISMWGEPALHKDFLELVDYASATGKRVTFSTNLNYSERIAERLADNPNLHIICSVDGWDEESYGEYRLGGRFEVMKRNLAILARGRCHAYPQILVTGNDPDQRASFLAFMAEVGADLDNVLFKPKLDNIRNDPLATVPGRCSSMYGGLYFNCDGILVPCCTNVREDLHLRHVSAYSAEDLRNAAEIKSLRRRILADKNQFASCRACKGEDHQKTITDKLWLRLPAPLRRARGMFGAPAGK